MPKLASSLWSKVSRRPFVSLSTLVLLFWMVVVWFGPRTWLYRCENKEALLNAETNRFRFECLVKSVKRKSGGVWVRAEIRAENFLNGTYIEGYLPTKETATVGDWLKIYSKLELPEAPSNPGQFDAETYYALRKTDYLMTCYSCEKIGHQVDFFSVMESFRQALSENLFAIMPEKEAGIASAILLGTSDLVDAETKELFQNAGISHLLAVSGLHVMSFFKAVSLGLEKLLSKRKGSIATIVFVWLYVLLTGYSVSAVRAGFMLTFRVVARLFYRTDDPLVSYVVPAAIIVSAQPLYLRDAGFWLSFGAMLGIRFMSPVIDEFYFVPKFLRKALGASLAVLLFTTPITLWYYYEFNPYSLLLNPIVIPFVSYVYALSAIGALVSFISPLLGRFAVGLVYFILQGYFAASKAINSLPGANWLIGKPEVWQMVGYYVLLFGFIAFWYLKPEAQKRFWYVWAGVGAICVLLLHPFRQDQVIFLNVGQGDCAVIECEHKVYLVDAGPNYTKVIKPYLRSRGIRVVDGVFLSHPDADHMAGVQEMIFDPDFDVRTLYLADASYSNSLLTEGLSAQLVYLSSGQSLQYKNITFTCLSPQKSKTYENDNDASMVLYFSAPGFEVLFMGDIEESGEKALLSRLPLQRDGVVSVIKIAHHGSKTSTSEALLSRINMDAAIISAKKSVYGHPHEETLSRLQEHGILWYITETRGAIRLTRKGLKCFN